MLIKFKKIYLKLYLVLVPCLLPWVLMAQLQFEGESEPISQLNSPYDEGYVAIHPSGNLLVYSRFKNPNNPEGLENEGSLWVSEFDSIWSSPKALAGLQARAANISLGFYNQLSFVADVREVKGAWVSKVFSFKSADWTPGSEVSIDYFGNLSGHLSGSVSADGNFLVLSMEGKATYGVEDIYVCKRNNKGGWGAPKNLSSVINTPFQEFTPFLSTDTKTLFWSTNGRDGVGSFDVFMATRLDETWQNWSEPISLGVKINTEGAETSFQMAGDYGYFVSTTDSDGYGDIRRIKLSQPLPEVAFEEQEEEELVAESPDIKTFLLRSAAGEVVEGDVTVKSERLDSVIQGVTQFQLRIVESSDLTVLVDAPDHLPFESVFTSDKLTSEKQFELTLESLDVGNTIQLQHVLFRRGTDELLSGSEELEVVVGLLNKYPGMRILVKGHTDSQGDPSRNLRLSRQRAKKVRDYILNSGIPSSRVEGKGYGGNVPIASNETEATRKLNRRVEFTILSR